jgi:hypothetical protein
MLLGEGGLIFTEQRAQAVRLLACISEVLFESQSGHQVPPLGVIFSHPGNYRYRISNHNATPSFNILPKSLFTNIRRFHISY